MKILKTIECILNEKIYYKYLQPVTYFETQICNVNDEICKSLKMFNWKCFKTDDIRYHPISSTKKAVKRKYVLFFGIRWNIVKTFISMLKKGGINFWKKMRKQKVCIFIVSDNAKCTTYIYILYHPNDKLSVVKKTETNWEKSIIKQSSYLAWLPEKKRLSYVS